MKANPCSVRRSVGLAGLALVAGTALGAAIVVGVGLPLLRPLPYQQPEQLVVVWNRLPDLGLPRLWNSEPQYAVYRDRTRGFESLAAYALTSHEMARAERSERLAGRHVTASLFPLLGIEPMLGRTLEAWDEQPHAAPVAVLSHTLWTRLGADPGAVGRTLELDGRPVLVVGVMPEGFAFPSPEVQIWTPLKLDPLRPRKELSHYLTVLGRLRPELELEQVEAEVNAIAAALPGRTSSASAARVVLSPLQAEVLGELRGAPNLLLALLGLGLIGASLLLGRRLLARSATSVLAEAALCLMLLLGTGVMLCSFPGRTQLDPGLRPLHGLTLEPGRTADSAAGRTRGSDGYRQKPARLAPARVVRC